MKNKRALWNYQQSILKDILLKPVKFNEAIKLCLEQHAMVHSSAMSQTDEETIEDELWEGVGEDVFRKVT